MAGLAGAHLFVERVGGVAAGVADCGRVHARELPVETFGAPETAKAEDGDLMALGHGAVERRSEHKVGGLDRHGLGTTGKGLIGLGHGLLVTAEKHAGLLRRGMQ